MDETFSEYEEQYTEPDSNNEEQYLDEEELLDGQERMEDQHDDVENVEWADIPQQKRTEGLYNLFQKVLKSKDNSKVANLDKYELGPQPFMNVRNAQFLALLGSTFHHHRFARFFYDLSEITLKTSASKKGWFTELFVSQKKQTTRFSGINTPPQPPINRRKRFNLFGAQPNESIEAAA